MKFAVIVFPGSNCDNDAYYVVEKHLGLSVDLEIVNSTQGINYFWSPSDYLSCQECENPISSPEESTTYVVSATDQNGCTSYDTLQVIVEGQIDLFIPNIFIK